MAKKKEDKADVNKFAEDVLDQLNKKFGGKSFFTLGKDKENPASIQRWYNTKLLSLNAILGGNIDRGFPGGRVVEISGPESIGKSHICYQVAQSVQEQGGFSLYIDTEQATDKKNLAKLGIDLEDPKFIFTPAYSIEEAFDKASEFLKSMAPLAGKVPIAIFYDSVGGVGSKLEHDMAFDSVQRPGLNAKQITFGLRKLTSAIAATHSLFCLVNQEYDIINAGMFDKKQETKGGKFIKYASSNRLALKVVTQVYPEDMDRTQAFAKGLRASGIRVRARTNKNKIAAPYRSIEFDIVFGVGVKEHMSLWEMFVKEKEIQIKDKILQFSGGAWKTINVCNAKTGVSEKEIKFRKKDIEHKLMKEHYEEITKPCARLLFNRIMDPDNREADEYDAGVDGSYNDKHIDEEEAMKEI